MIHLKSDDHLKVYNEIKSLMSALKHLGWTGTKLAERSNEVGSKFTQSTLSRCLSETDSDKISLNRKYSILSTLKIILRSLLEEDPSLADKKFIRNIDLGFKKSNSAPEDVNINKADVSPLKEVFDEMVQNKDLVSREEIKNLEKINAKEILVITSNLKSIKDDLDNVLMFLRRDNKRKFRIILTDLSKNADIIKMRIDNYGHHGAAEQLEIRRLYTYPLEKTNAFPSLPVLSDIVLYKIEKDSDKKYTRSKLVGYYSITLSNDTSRGFDCRISDDMTDEIELWFENTWKEIKDTSTEINPLVIAENERVNLTRQRL